MKIRTYKNWFIEAFREGIRGFIAIAWRQEDALHWAALPAIQRVEVLCPGGYKGRFRSGLDAIEAAKARIDELEN